MQYLTILSHIVLIVLLCKVVPASLQLLGPSEWKISENGRLDFPELAAKYGHPAETKYIITEDGYNLTMYHIPGDIKRSVLLIHGNSPTVECWITRGKVSIAVTLADQSYDVWVLALRGSLHSRRHISLDPEKNPKKFYNFTLYEQAIYDLASGIDLVLAETGQSKTLLIGHSSGNALFYALGASKPEYNDKIKLAIALAPICYLKHAEGILGVGFYLLDKLRGFFEFANIYVVNVLSIIQILCLQPLGYEICVKSIFFSFTGYDEKGIEPDFLNTLVGHWPDRVSIKFTVHEGQMAVKDKFVRYDYGKARNLRAYGSEEPPEFDLSKVTMKIALFRGKGDFFTNKIDINRLNNTLPNVVHYEDLPYENFNHLDFVWGQHMDKNLHPYLFPVIEKYI